MGTVDNRTIGVHMKVICADGSVIDCDRFQATEEGVLIFNQTKEETESNVEANGFIPHGSLRYVLPESAIEEQTQAVNMGAEIPGTGQWVQDQVPSQHVLQHRPSGTLHQPGTITADRR